MSEIKVPFNDFKAPYQELKAELDEAYHRFMESGWLVLGKETSAFEEEYAAYCEAAHCVGVSNGLEALHLALRALEVGPGDEVIVPSNTYIATWLAVTQAGGTPVPVEPDPATFNLDPSLVEEAISPRTKVILSVNLYGQPCDYDPLMEIAEKRGLKLAIDNAQSHGARYKGRRVGGIADIECHSFYPSKNLGAYGEAGAITTHDPDLADKIRVLRNYGSRVRYHNEMPGYNARIDELQAAFLRVKLRKLDEWNARRTAIAERYLSDLRPLATGSLFSSNIIPSSSHADGDKSARPAVTPYQASELSAPSTIHDPLSTIVLPTVPPWAKPVWHLFVIRHPQRNALQKHLADNGIQTLIHYPIPPHQSGAYGSFNSRDLPIAAKLAGEILSLPLGPHMDPAHSSLVTEAIINFTTTSTWD
jgi:dTDP-4-amino-4,6-dideoxygalactose transaminase